MKSQNLFSISLLLLVASSCTIHKRHYSKGYFISWNKAYKSEQPIEQEKPHEHIVSKTIDEEILEQEEIQVEQIIDFKSQYTNVDNEQKYSTQKVNKSFSLENTTVLGNRVNKIKVYTNEEQKVNLNALLGFVFGVVSWLIILVSMLVLTYVTFLPFVSAFVGLLLSLASIKGIKNTKNDNPLTSSISQNQSSISHKRSKFFMISGLILNGLILSLGIFAVIYFLFFWKGISFNWPSFM
jgi:hypothetical protein